mmetsp:Transcript_64229/g.187917  ORF Transcript_64229/g.187917 Transcript_64229/m.187917 type:complete len:276 (-) Transcript_64229:2-829(-)
MYWRLLSQSLPILTPIFEGLPPTAAARGQQAVLPWKATYQISTSRRAASAKPPARKVETSRASPRFIVPSGNQPASPPEATCSSISFWRSAISSLSSSMEPSAPADLKGTALWPMALTMAPITGIFRRWPETSILILACCARGMKVTSRMVSRKDAWFATMTAGRPEAPSAARNSARPSTSCRTQKAQSRARRHMRQVKTSTARSRKDPGCMGLTAAARMLSLAKKKTGRVQRAMERLKKKTATFAPNPMAAGAAAAVRLPERGEEQTLAGANAA